MDQEKNATRKIGHVVFDVDLKFILVKINEDKYDVPITEIKSSKYHEIIHVIKSFMDVFGKKMDCWEELVSYDGVNYYCIKTDFDEINIDDKDDYDFISISDFEIVDCTDRLKWITYMALDKSVRKATLSTGHGFAL